MSTTPSSDPRRVGDGLTWADSEVRGLAWHGADLHLVFSAASVTRPDPVGGGSEPGFLRGLTLVGRAAQLGPHADLAAAQGRLHSVRTPQGPAPVLAVPGEHPGPLQLVLAFANGTQLSLHVQGLEARLSPDWRWFPSLAC